MLKYIIVKKCFFIYTLLHQQIIWFKAKLYKLNPNYMKAA